MASDGRISTLSPISGLDRTADLFEVADVSLGASKNVTINAALGILGAPVGTTDAQTLSSKTLSNTNSITVLASALTIQDPSDSSKQAQFVLSGITTGTTRSYTLPNASGTLMDLASAQTATNKTFTSAVLNTPTINNPSLNTDSISQFTPGNGVTVAGLNIKSGVLNANNSVITANITDAAITPAKLVAGSGTGWSWQTFVPAWTNLTPGNGTVTARYTQTGKQIWLQLTFVLGSTSSVGTNPGFTPPVAASSVYTTVSVNTICGYGYLGSASTAAQAAPFFNGSNALIDIGYYVPSATNNNLAATSATLPGSWTTGNYMTITCFYEAA